MPEFLHDESRDASAAIRGYVYQVDTTILRWLALNEAEELQLECGEDIDHVTKWLPDEARVLEQVKHLLRKPVTLRSPAVVATIAHAVLHVARNPGLKLRFLFTTNAPMGQENPPLMPDGQPGLKGWLMVQRAGVGTKDKNRLVRRIRKHLLGASSQHGFKGATGMISAVTWAPTTLSECIL